LQAAARGLLDAVRPGDMVGRIGGDEFVVLLIGVSDRYVASEVAQHISATLPRLVPYGTRLLRLGATLGVAVMPADADDPEIAVRIADEALVRAKREGRGSVGCATRQDAARLLREAAIIRAFDADIAENDAVIGATVYFQPIVTLDYTSCLGVQVIAVEALARWTHAEVGDVPPGELFPMIGPDRAARLGQAVREQALKSFALFQADGLAGARVALNLSAGEVARMDIALHIEEQVERAGLSLRDVEIEITEEVLLDRVSDRTLEQLTALRGRGARLVLDDFGTGNSGLAQLLRLPLDGVKLEKQFIQRLGVDVRAMEIVRATISLAHSLGLEVVAEGIETEQQMAMLRTVGCDTVQGFLLARPMTTEALRAWLHKRKLDGISNVFSIKPKNILKLATG
jgi:EAL domain-containing protein (putative c-di-GMP-specific phosphodiesterase class I)